MKISSLAEQLNELRRNFDDVSCKKEWAEAKLSEVQSQIQLFGDNVPFRDSAMSGQRSGRNRLVINRPGSIMESRRATESDLR